MFNIFSAITEIAATSIPENINERKDAAAMDREMRTNASMEISDPNVFRSVMTIVVDTKAVPPLEIRMEIGVVVEAILFCIPRLQRDNDSPIREEAKILLLTKAVIIPLRPLPITP